MLSLSQFTARGAAAGAAVRADEKRFSELDAAAGGDGDHGTAIVTAFNAMGKADGADFKSYLKALSEALQSEACGSTSTLYGAWLEGMSGAARKARPDSTRRRWRPSSAAGSRRSGSSPAPARATRR
jgi:dihydroxyacetone kinase